MDLEQKLTVAKEELEKTALDKVTDRGRGFTWDTCQIRYCVALMGMALDLLARYALSGTCLRGEGAGVGGVSCEFK